MAEQVVGDDAYWARRAEQQLALAKAAVDPTVRAIHLNLASRYATQGELAEREGLAEREIAQGEVTFSERNGETGNEAEPRVGRSSRSD